MKRQKTSSLLLIALTSSLISFGQELTPNLFLRTPQVVNYNLNDGQVSYNPVISVGTGLSLGSKFIELATFISDDDIHGFYTFFGTTLKTLELNTNINLNTNWFGEITYVPEQDQNPDSFTYTTGICFFLNHSFEWGSIGIPLCLGVAYNEGTISLNTRTILNLSLNLSQK